MADQHKDLDRYDWMSAPAHLKTRRQLRAAGLRPNGQDVAALMVRERRGRRLVAHLYDVRLAAPKRTATPAQLIAVAKAVRGHQLAAALRRGFTEEQLTTVADPGDAWTTPVTPEKGNPMSNNETAEVNDKSIAIDYARYLAEQLAQAEKDARTPGLFVGQVDGAPTRAVGPAEGVGWVVEESRRQLHTHLIENRFLLGDAAQEWAQHFADIDDAAVISTKVKPVGHGQRLAHLHAVVALNQSRHRREQRERERVIALGEGVEAGVEFTELLTEAREAAKDRLSQPIRWANRDRVAMTLTDALSWRGELDVADDVVTKVVGAYASDWGVIIDPDKRTVRIDEKHNAAERQAFDEVAVVWDRESAVIDIVSASGLAPEAKGPVMEAIHRWRGEATDLQDPQRHVADQAERREQLRAELAELPIPAEARAYVEVTVDYLRGDVSEVDLLATPVLVDPGEEARGRMRGLLDLYADGSIAPQFMAEEIAVLSPADQQIVREIGRGIRDGKNPDRAVWADCIDRDAFTEDLLNYLNDAEDQRAEADYIVENHHPYPDQLGINDDFEDRLPRMAAARDALHATVKGSQGLNSTERHQLTALLADIEVGRVLTDKQLPELLFLDERTKSEVDSRRETAVVDAAIADLPTEVSTLVTAKTSLAQDNPVHQVISTAAKNLHSTVRSVAHGIGSVEQNRELYTAQRTALGKALSRAGVDRDTMGEIRTLVDTTAKAAAQTRMAATARREQWPAKVEKACADRDRAAAKPQAQAASARSCRTRLDRSAARATEATADPARVHAPHPEMAEQGFER